MRDDPITFRDAKLSRKLPTYRQGGESVAQTAKRLLNDYISLLEQPEAQAPGSDAVGISSALREATDNLSDAVVQIERARRMVSVGLKPLAMTKRRAARAGSS